MTSRRKSSINKMIDADAYKSSCVVQIQFYPNLSFCNDENEYIQLNYHFPHKDLQYMLLAGGNIRFDKTKGTKDNVRVMRGYLRGTGARPIHVTLVFFFLFLFFLFLIGKKTCIKRRLLH